MKDVKICKEWEKKQQCSGRWPGGKVLCRTSSFFVHQANHEDSQPQTVWIATSLSAGLGKEGIFCFIAEGWMRKEQGGNLQNVFCILIWRTLYALLSRNLNDVMKISAGKQTSDYIALTVEEEPNKKKDKTFKRKQQETTPNLATLQVREK